MAIFQLRLLGCAELVGPSGRVPIGGDRAAALLGYLATQPRRVFSRSHLASMLYESSSETAAASSLNSLLSRLCRALPVHAIRVVPGGVVWQPVSDLTVDTELFMEWGAVPAHQDQAVALWRGALLEDVQIRGAERFEQWLEAQRRIWEQRLLETCVQLVARAQAAAEWSAALAHAEMALRVNPVQEEFHRAIMLALYQSGNRTGALQRYQLCERILEAHLGVSPDSETRRMRAVIAGDVAASATVTPATVTPATGPTGSPPALATATRPASRLDEIKTALRGTDCIPARVVLLRGPTGCGKTALVQRLVHQHRSQASPDTGTVIVAGGNDTEKFGPPAARFRPIITALLPHLSPADVPLANEWLATVEDGNESWLVLVATQLLLAAPDHILLILEDLHRSDAHWWGLFAGLARNADGRKLSLLATLQPGALAPAAQLLLSGLERDQMLYPIDLVVRQ